MKATIEFNHRVACASAVPAHALTPAQQRACEKLETLLTASPIVALTSVDGLGRTRILDTLARKYQGKLISLRDVTEATANRGPDTSDAAIGALILSALEQADTVLVDDFQAISLSTLPTRMAYFRFVARKHIYDTVMKSGKRLIIAGQPPMRMESGGDFSGNEVAVADMPLFTAVDYAVIAENILGSSRAAGIDFQQVYRYAPILNGHQLRAVCKLIEADPAPTTSAFIDQLERHILTSNTRLSEVESLRFDSLPGAEHIAAQLETHVVMPLKNHAIARQLDLKPKRGVLLYGPPGTGKTSIGRALAHRIEGKFFLIDGSFVTEPPALFFKKLQDVIAEAKKNSPSVLFIDDADVLFRIEHISGLARYLLSLLDGLESETANNVCVVMTAMDVRKIPDALLRSGRVELWLETREPDEFIRAQILQRWISADLPGHASIDYVLLARATEGFTPADLRRIAGDAKSLDAADRIKQSAPVTGTDYVKRAIDAFVTTRSRMATTLGDESLRVGVDRPKSKYAKGVGGSVQIGTCEADGW